MVVSIAVGIRFLRNLAGPSRVAPLLGAIGTAITLLACGPIGAEVDGLATARVGGLEYVVSVARSLEVPDTDLRPFADAEIDPLFEFDGVTARAITGVDPERLLVLLLEPGQNDDAGPLGRYVLLVRGPDAFGLVCEYFDPTSEATPSICRNG